MKFSMCFCHNDLGESLWMTLNLSRCSCSDFPVLTSSSSTLEPRKYGKSRICLKAIHMSKSSHPGLFKGFLKQILLYMQQNRILLKSSSQIYSSFHYYIRKYVHSLAKTGPSQKWKLRIKPMHSWDHMCHHLLVTSCYSKLFGKTLEAEI